MHSSIPEILGLEGYKKYYVNNDINWYNKQSLFLF